MSTLPTRRRQALGTYVFLGTRIPSDLETADRIVAEILDDVDRSCSRFRADSDLSMVNSNPGVWVEVDPILAAAVAAACSAADQTGGLVNPLLGRPLVQLGYDRDFERLAEIESDPALATYPGTYDVPEARAWADIAVDPAGAVRIPQGTALDLGATAKAWTADLIASTFRQELDGAALVSLGGDIRISAPDGTAWPIAISEHADDEVAARIGLDHGGLATSSTRVRRWTRAGVRRHHLLDPRTGLPAREVWRTATATGPTCVAANIASTTAIVLGHLAPNWLARRHVTARLVASDGRVQHIGEWPTEDWPTEEWDVS